MSFYRDLEELPAVGVSDEPLSLDFPDDVFGASGASSSAPAPAAPPEVADTPAATSSAPPEMFSAPPEMFDAPVAVFDPSAAAFSTPPEVFEAPSEGAPSSDAVRAMVSAAPGQTPERSELDAPVIGASVPMPAHPTYPTVSIAPAVPEASAPTPTPLNPAPGEASFEASSGRGNDTVLPYVGIEHEPSAAERLAADLDPGLSPVARSEEILTKVGHRPVREIVEQVRKEEEGWKGTHGGAGFDPRKLREVVDALAFAPAQALGVLDTVLAKHVQDVYGGLYGLEEHLGNPWVSDVLINKHDEVFIEEAGVMKRVSSPFDSAEEITNFYNRLVGKYHLEAPTTTQPIRDWNFQYALDDGSEVSVRVNIVLGTNTDTGEPIISMRKPVSIGKFDQLDTWAQVREGDSDSAMSRQAVEFLRAVIKHRATILIVGGTGSGKTSLLKALVNEIPADLRILSIEESQELVLKRPNARGLLAQGNLDLADLVISAMRMRPDIIIIGEARRPTEATQYLNAANTGHDGSITTTHASGTEAGLMRILNLINEASSTKASLEYVGGQVLSAVDVIIFIAAQTKEQPNGEIKRLRRIMEISTLYAYSAKDNQIKFEVKPVFGRYTSDLVGINRRTNIEAPLRCEGYKGVADRFVDKMDRFGLPSGKLKEILELGPKKSASPSSGEPAPKSEAKI